MKKLSTEQSRKALKIVIYVGLGIAGWFILWEILPYILYFLTVSSGKLSIPVIALVGYGLYRHFFPKTDKQIREELEQSQNKKSGWFTNFIILAFFALIIVLIISVIISS